MFEKTINNCIFLSTSTATSTSSIQHDSSDRSDISRHNHIVEPPKPPGRSALLRLYTSSLARWEREGGIRIEAEWHTIGYLQLHPLLQDTSIIIIILQHRQQVLEDIITTCRPATNHHHHHHHRRRVGRPIHEQALILHQEWHQTFQYQLDILHQTTTTTTTWTQTRLHHHYHHHHTITNTWVSILILGLPLDDHQCLLVEPLRHNISKIRARNASLHLERRHRISI